MRSIDVHELPARVANGEPVEETLAVERDGKVIGYFVPVNWRDPAQVRRSYERFDRSVEAARSSGTSATEFVEILTSGNPSTRSD